MSALFLIDIKHKLETQDIFRSKTVKALVVEIERLTEQNQRFTEWHAEQGRMITELREVVSAVREFAPFIERSHMETDAEHDAIERLTSALHKVQS